MRIRKKKSNKESRIRKKRIEDSQKGMHGFAKKNRGFAKSILDSQNKSSLQNHNHGFAKKNLGFAKKNHGFARTRKKRIEDSQKKKQGFASRREM